MIRIARFFNLAIFFFIFFSIYLLTNDFRSL
nr:MAG TPA: hypothetical protein [Caudoviricetes sp.]